MFGITKLGPGAYTLRVDDWAGFAVAGFPSGGSDYIFCGRIDEGDAAYYSVERPSVGCAWPGWAPGCEERTAYRILELRPVPYFSTGSRLLTDVNGRELLKSSNDNVKGTFAVAGRFPVARVYALCHEEGRTTLRAYLPAGPYDETGQRELVAYPGPPPILTDEEDWLSAAEVGPGEDLVVTSRSAGFYLTKEVTVVRYRWGAADPLRIGRSPVRLMNGFNSPHDWPLVVDRDHILTAGLGAELRPIDSETPLRSDPNGGPRAAAHPCGLIAYADRVTNRTIHLQERKSDGSWVRRTYVAPGAVRALGIVGPCPNRPASRTGRPYLVGLDERCNLFWWGLPVPTRPVPLSKEVGPASRRFTF